MAQPTSSRSPIYTSLKSSRSLGTSQIPAEIQNRPPTTDTYSLEQSQEEFYFMLPLEKMDLCLYGKNRGISADDLAPAVGIDPLQVARMYGVIDAKRKAGRYLHAPPLLVEEMGDGQANG